MLRRTKRSSKIKTIHIIGSAELGGAESFFIRFVDALAQAGHETIAVSRKGGPIAKLLSPAVRQVHLPFASKWDYWTRWQLGRLIKAEQPAVVQTYMSRATRLTRMPAGSTAVHVARLGGYYTIPGNYDHAEAWVGNTRDICDYLIKQGLPAERIFHIGNFVPQPRNVSADELASLRAALQLPDDAVVVFALGRMIEKKGFQDLIEAFATLPPDHDGRPLRLLLVGDGTERERYETLAKKLGVIDRVRFAGWQTDPVPYFRLANVFVCPSRHEPLGNILLEAWTHRLPVLTTRNEGAQELVGDDESALLVPVRDPAEMANGLRRMLALTDAERTKMVAAGVETVRVHSGDAVIRKYLELYEELQRRKSSGWVKVA
ncbi:glycosyltransferase [Noviherbaspirillum aridicola]|uniref:Glycosyl transferase n=1 Tax=Noviherbaspirillum aridicola TaxID=2849687 RepID=A0ABQ4Q8U7_9BURK|nr:glycosyltransferase [Noviherbaspirillum aridicola]GIZ53492.1 glycosyl transferase [Noviherbaspirillum aridicola]